MTHKEQIIAMLDHCGLEYDITDAEMCSFSERVGTSYKTHNLPLNVITVYGTFYEELYIYFDFDDNLVEMQSHVVYTRPSSRKLKEIVGIG